MRGGLSKSVLLAGVLALCGLASAGAGAGAASAAPGYRLAFASTIDTSKNGGPLIVKGHRLATTDSMVADQIIKNADNTESIRAGIGELVYEEYPGSLSHRHWHYKAFVRYQLRSTSDLSLVRPDNKAGFCLSDPVFAPDFCGSLKPYALTVEEGLGPDTRDYYNPGLEGQYIDVTDVPPGEYWLVHWVNSGKEICESEYANNAGAVKLVLWPNGYGVAPYFTQKEAVNPFPSLYADPTPPAGCTGPSAPGSGLPDLAPETPAELGMTVVGLEPPASVPPGTAGLPAPGARAAPALSERLARRYVVRALTKRFHRRPRQLRQACRRLDQTSFLCRVQWRHRHLRYRGSVRIFTVGTRNGFERRFDLRVKRTNSRCALARPRGCSRVFKIRNAVVGQVEPEQQASTARVLGGTGPLRAPVLLCGLAHPLNR